jgi:hypothetical protein
MKIVMPKKWVIRKKFTGLGNSCLEDRSAELRRLYRFCARGFQYVARPPLMS